MAYIGEERLLTYAKKYVDAFLGVFVDLQDKQPLSVEQQNALWLGTLLVGRDASEILLTSFHPLNIAYQMNLMNENGFELANDAIIEKLNSIYLLPYLQLQKKVYKVSDQFYSMEWKHYALTDNRKFMGGRKYVPKLVEDKIKEFTEHFKYIFKGIGNRVIKINLINMGDCSDVLCGIAQYYCHSVKKIPDINKMMQFEIHVYSTDFFNNAFNLLKDREALGEFLSREKLSIESGITMSDLEGILGRNIRCYFCHDDEKDYKYVYAHITFYEMESEVTSEMAAMEQIPTGMSLGGIFSGVPSCKYGTRYRTGFGSKYAANSELESIAELYNSLIQVSDTGNPYQQGVGISTQIDSRSENKMDAIYDASNWVVFVDPKVDLDFFSDQENSGNLLIIHYSDQYTSSSGYDAITVTKKSEQYSIVIKDYLAIRGVQAKTQDISNVINLFNAINGDWLLRLVSAKKSVGKYKDALFSREKISIVAAIKLMLVYLKHPDILWVPISMEEMLRVSGGVGLSQKDSILSAKNLGFDGGPTSDDLLFIGVQEVDKGIKIYLYPVEVKTGNNSGNVITKAIDQVKNTADGLANALDPVDDNTSQITYRAAKNFMIQLLVNSCKKMQIYHVDDTQDWDIVLDRLRTRLLNEEYTISSNLLGAIGKGAVLSFKKERHQRIASLRDDSINFIEVPESDEYNLILESIENIEKALQNEGGHFAPWRDFDLTDVVHEEGNRPENEGNTPEADNVEDRPNAGSDAENKTVEGEEANIDQEESGKEPENEIDDGIKICFGENQLDGSDIYWTPNDTDQVFHTNTGIIGTMGTGKTQFTKSLITQLYREQSKNVEGKPVGILIFDYKGDYNESKKDFVVATEAKVLKPYHLPFNPLTLTSSPVFKPLLPIHTANAFKDTLSKVYGLGPKQENTLLQCILNAYHQAGIDENDSDSWVLDAPTFENVFNIFSDNEDIKKGDKLEVVMNKLHQFQVFESNPSNAISLFELLDGVVVIDLSGYDEDIQSLVVAITLDLFYSQMQAAGSSRLEGKYRQLTKMILVDEADNFMSQDFPSLKKILKEGREFGVGTILSTQFLKHFGTGEDDYSKYILTWVVHNVADLKSSDIDFVFNVESKSVEEQKLFNDIKKLQKHHSIMKIGTSKPIYVEDLPFWKLMSR